MDTNAARYLGGYVTKKMSKKEDPRLDGRFPEFSRQSRRPGVGAPLVADMAKQWMRFEDGRVQDVGGLLTFAGNQKRPMGTYLRRKFREAVGTTEEVKGRADYEAWLEQMLPLHEAAKASQSEVSLRAQICAASAPVDERLKFRETIYRAKRGRAL